MGGFIDPTGGLLNNQVSYSKDALVTTSYRDDNIVRGNIFSYGIIVSAVSETPIYYTFDKGDLTEFNALFLLPIVINPTNGYVQLNIYEDTLYSGGTQIYATNRNRNSSITQKGIVRTAPTVTVTKGTLLSLSEISGVDSTNQNSGGGRAESADALVLDVAKRYLFEFIPSETGLISITSEFGEL